MTHIFDTSYSVLLEHTGKHCDIFDNISLDRVDVYETGPMYLVQVETGEVIEAWPDELTLI